MRNKCTFVSSHTKHWLRLVFLFDSDDVESKEDVDLPDIHFKREGTSRLRDREIDSGIDWIGIDIFYR